MTQKYKDTVSGIKETEQVLSFSNLHTIVPDNRKTASPSTGSSWMNVRSILHPIIANFIAACLIGIVFYVVADLVEIKRFDGLWACYLNSKSPLKIEIIIRGFSFDINNDSVTGVARSASVRSSEEKLYSYTIQPEPFSGRIIRKLYVILSELRVRGTLWGRPFIITIDTAQRTEWKEYTTQLTTSEQSIVTVCHPTTISEQISTDPHYRGRPSTRCGCSQQATTNPWHTRVGVRDVTL